MSGANGGSPYGLEPPDPKTPNLIATRFTKKSPEILEIIKDDKLLGDYQDRRALGWEIL